VAVKYIIAKLRTQCNPDKIDVDKDNPIGHYILRPISFYLTVPCLRWGLSANQTTFIGIGIGLAGCLMLGLGAYWSMITGAVLMILSDVFDVIDGNIARYKKEFSTYGAYIDAVVSGEIAYNLVPFAVGIGTGNILIGSICSISMFARTVITEGYSATFQVKARTFYKGNGGLWGFIYKYGLALSVSMSWVLLIGAIIDHSFWVLAFWTLMAVSEFIAVTAWTLVKAKDDN
jgi:phosphatidylglycerophosphate synthase